MSFVGWEVNSPGRQNMQLASGCPWRTFKVRIPPENPDSLPPVLSKRGPPLIHQAPSLAQIECKCGCHRTASSRPAESSFSARATAATQIESPHPSASMPSRSGTAPDRPRACPLDHLSSLSCSIHLPLPAQARAPSKTVPLTPPPLLISFHSPP